MPDRRSTDRRRDGYRNCHRGFAGRVRILSRQRLRKQYLAVPRREVLPVERDHPVDACRQIVGELPGQRNEPILLALRLADVNATVLEVDVLDPKGQRLGDPHAGAVEQGRHLKLPAVELGEQALHLGPRHDHRCDRLALGAREVLQLAQRHEQHALVEEDQSVQRLILGAGADVAGHDQLVQELRHPVRTYLLRRLATAKGDVAAEPVLVALLGLPGIPPHTNLGDEPYD